MSTEAMALTDRLEYLASGMVNNAPTLESAAAMIRQHAGEIERLTTETGRLKSMWDESRAEVSKIRKELIRVESTRCTAIEQLIIAQEDLRSQRAVNERLTGDVGRLDARVCELEDLRLRHIDLLEDVIQAKESMCAIGIEQSGFAEMFASFAGQHQKATTRVRELEAAEQWLPIESAPRDDRILVPATKRMGMCVAMHHSCDGWVTETTSEWAPIYTPTHWRPLPAPPAQQQGEG